MLQACWCASDYCKIHGCQLAKQKYDRYWYDSVGEFTPRKQVWDKDRFKDLGNVSIVDWNKWVNTQPVGDKIEDCVPKEKEKMEETEKPQEVLDAEYEREIQLGPIIAVIEHLLNSGVSVEEIIRRLVTS